MARVYTRTGDKGDTSLACGSRLPKDDLRIEAYGTLDELSSVLGVVSALLIESRHPKGARFEAFQELIEWMQDKLFTLSGMLATANLPAGNMPEVTAEDVVFLEKHIDVMEQDLPELRHFILPGGSEVVSFIHLARTVCRRAERVCTTLDRETPLNQVLLPFLNRLSDELFVMGRWVAWQRQEEEKLWLGRRVPEQTLKRFVNRQELAIKLTREPDPQLSLFNADGSPEAAISPAAE